MQRQLHFDFEECQGEQILSHCFSDAKSAVVYIFLSKQKFCHVFQGWLKKHGKVQFSVYQIPLLVGYRISLL